MTGALVWLQPPGVHAQSLHAARRAGLEFVLWRQPEAPAKDFYAATALAREAGLVSIVNDRLDVALALQAPCHLRGDSLPLSAARRIAAQIPLGRSVHSVEEAVAAERDGADYLLFGHIFATAAKLGRSPNGTAALAEVVAAVSLPVLAIGGIGPQNAREVFGSGCAGIVVRSAIAREAPASCVGALRAACAAAGPSAEEFREVMARCASG